MAGTAKEWNMYQVSKALLRRDQQKILSLCEWSMGSVDVWNEGVNAWRGGEYTPAENERFLNELAEVNIYTKDKFTIQKPFDSVKSHHSGGDTSFSIRVSDYFSKVICAYIRDNWGELYD